MADDNLRELLNIMEDEMDYIFPIKADKEKRDKFFGVCLGNLEVGQLSIDENEICDFITDMHVCVFTIKWGTTQIISYPEYRPEITTCSRVSEEVGKKVFDKQKKAADKAYKKPEEAALKELPKNRKEGVLYILTDGLQVNTRIEDENGSTRREMKIGLVF
jgi:hypothetical protein